MKEPTPIINYDEHQDKENESFETLIYNLGFLGYLKKAQEQLKKEREVIKDAQL